MTEEICRCNCGYTCGGPGRCTEPWEKCMAEHWVRDCDHDFTGDMKDVFGDGLCHSRVCAKCGMSAFSHDMQVGP